MRRQAAVSIQVEATIHVETTVIRAAHTADDAQVGIEDFAGTGAQVTIEEAQKYLTPIRPAAEQPVRLRLCETIVAITAPKGRIDEFLGDHRKDLRDLVQEFGVERGTWYCRLRLAETTLRMLPAIAMRVWALWKIS